MNKCLLFSLGVLISLLGQAQFPTALADNLQTALDQAVAAGHNGVSACVTLYDGSTWHGSAGVDGLGDAVTDSTLFHSASLTKSHVATCAMLLVEEGVLDLDASWTTYVSEAFPFNTDITVGQLLSHTAGIQDYLEQAGTGALILDEPTYAWLPAEILNDVASSTPAFSPGNGFGYSNSNYVLLGLVIEAIEAQPLATSLHERIWEPLGLDNTYFGGYETLVGAEAGVWWNFGTGLANHSGIDQTAMLTLAYAAGNLVSTPHDQSTFLQALLEGNLVNPTSLTAMQTWVPASFSSWTSGYGLGLHHASGVSGADVIGHDGYYSNMTSTYKHLELDFTIATATNTQQPWNAFFLSVYDQVLNATINSVEEEAQKLTPVPGPNPTSGLLNVPGLEQGQDVWISDLLGQVHLLVATTQGQVDLSSLPSGIYLVRIDSAQGLRQFRVLVEGR